MVVTSPPRRRSSVSCPRRAVFLRDLASSLTGADGSGLETIAENGRSPWLVCARGHRNSSGRNRLARDDRPGARRPGARRGGRRRPPRPHAGLGPAVPLRVQRARDGAADRAGRAPARGAVPGGAPAGGADGGREPGRRTRAWSCSPGTRPTTRSRCSPSAATARLGSAPARVAVGARTWAEHALGVQRALPGSALEIASPVIDRLRMVKSAGGGRGARRAPARPSTGCTPAWRSG